MEAKSRHKIAVTTRQHGMVNRWIKELKQFGLTPDEMLTVFAKARLRLKQLKTPKQK